MIKKQWPSFLVLSIISSILFLQCAKKTKIQFIEKLKQGQHQTIVIYGTSLSGKNFQDKLIDREWVVLLKKRLYQDFPNLIRVYNEALTGRASDAGVLYISNVMRHDPDVVFIEFAINDAYTNGTWRISINKCYSNLQTMYTQIKTSSKNCEIILQTMNPVAPGPEKVFRPNLDRYYKQYRKFAFHHKLPLIDHYKNWIKIFKTDMNLFLYYVPDTIHPNGKGCTNVIFPMLMKSIYSNN